VAVEIFRQILGSAAAPWLAPYSPLVQEIARDAESASVVAALNAARTNRSTQGVRFVEHSALEAGEPYESFIARTACIPTRENIHDFFNGMVWLTYPHTKRKLNVLQAGDLALHGSSGPRGALRDALTIFDENAALLQAPAELIEALRRRDWKTLFIGERQLWSSARLVVFGHALLEKLMDPRKAITAHVWVVDELSDAAVAASLTPDRLRAKPFLPLPVLGVPGWWDANNDTGFYDDVTIFRSSAPVSL
jgi:hypothetical protein